MRSTFAGFNTAVLGINANQRSLETVGHNVTNAGLSGYSRQSVNLVTSNPETIYGANGTYQMGTGVSVQSIVRARNDLVDKQYWKENATLTYNQNKADMLGKVESAFAEPTDTGIQSVLDNFWNAWQTLSTSASDDSARTAVREQGVALVNSIKTSSKQMLNMVSDINNVIDTKVNRINEISAHIAELNKKIFSIEKAGNDNANDLRDKRDSLVDEMSGIIDVNVKQDNNGCFIVQTAGGFVLADAVSSTRLATQRFTDPDYGYEMKFVKIEGSSPEQFLEFQNGELKSLIDMRDSTNGGIKGYLNNLSDISKFLLQDFNAVHIKGVGTDNTTWNNFFGTDKLYYGDSTTVPPTTAPPAGSGMTAYAPAAGTYLKKDWLDQLQVNQALFTSTGTAKIAAKTTANSIAVSQSNAAAPAATNITSTGNYTQGDTPTSVRLTVKTTAGGPPATSVASIDYETSADGGKTWSAKTNLNAAPAGSGTFTFPTLSGLNVVMTLPANVSTAVGDNYNFILSKGNVASGDNAVLLSSRLKVDTASSTLGNKTLDNYYSSMIGALGIQRQNAKNSQTNQQTMVDQIDNWRKSVSGVSLDEEMTNMLKFQKGYNSSARVMTTIDEMLDKLINSTGLVGR